VWTLHDYNLICPNISFISHNKICERCKKIKYIAPMLEKCSNDSLSASVTISAESIVHGIQSIKNRINYFISPSNFLKNKFVEYGFKEDKIIVLPNFNTSKNILVQNTFKRKYFLYLGRIGQEKGVETLCKAAKATNVNLLIAGDGPLKEELEKKYGSKKIKFLGHKTGKPLEKLRRDAWCLVIPSEWYENNPYSVIESFNDGVPVIGADIGGIPELVIDNKTGFLFESGNVNALKELLLKVNKLSIKERNTLGLNGKEHIKIVNNPKTYYNNLIKLYNKSITEEKRKWKHSSQ
jgi:glycosyltransferase involved in cell wall biosynthesis